MAAEVTAEMKEQIMDLFRQKKKMLAMRDVANALNLEHRTAKQALTDLINEGQLEFTSFGGATFIQLVP